MSDCKVCGGSRVRFVEWKVAPLGDFVGVAVYVECENCKDIGELDDTSAIGLD